MAEPVDYVVPPAPFPGAREELDDLIETLHASGTLRVLNGFFGRLGEVSGVALTEMNSPAGRNVLGSLLFVGECLAKISPDDLQRVTVGFSDGVKRARSVLADEPPGTLALLRLANAPDTRRTLAAMLVLLNSVGAALGR